MPQHLWPGDRDHRRQPRRDRALLSICGAYPWWSLAIFALCVYVVHGILVYGEDERPAPDRLPETHSKGLAEARFACAALRGRVSPASLGLPERMSTQLRPSGHAGGAPRCPSLDFFAFPAPPFELLESKLLPPQGRGGAVVREEVISSLEASHGTTVVCLSAGPGWGKTTLLAQWHSRAQRPFAWVSVDEQDNDPIVLLTYVAAALDRVSPLDPGVFDALASPGVSVEATVVPRLGAALTGMSEPVVLVMDDLHVLDNPASLDAIGALTRHVLNGSQMALSARGGPALPWQPCGRGAWCSRSGRTTSAWTRRRRASS